MLRRVFLSILVLLLAACESSGTDGNDSGIDSIKNAIVENSIAFKELTPDESGIDFKNTLTETVDFNYYSFEYIYNGGGVAIGDINNDGLQDIFFTGNQVGDKLYLNKGNLKFEDITSRAFTDELNEGWHTGVTMADVNSDGYLDIYVCRSGIPKDNKELTNLLYINNQNETFTERANEYGLGFEKHTTHAAFFDFDNDGDLDLYMLNHASEDSRNAKSIDEFLKSKRIGEDSDMLLENQNGMFTDISSQAGIENNTFGLGLGISDVNNDGFMDIYISCDYQDPEFLYINQGNGTFKNEIRSQTNHVSNFSMGNDIADINNDGWTDIFTLDMASEDHVRSKKNMGGMSMLNFRKLVQIGYHYQYMFNCLQLNNANGTFSDIGQLAGVSKTDWSWAPLLADFDNDGFKDLFVTNGYKREMRDNDYLNLHVKKIENEQDYDPLEELALVPTTEIQNYIFKNNGDLTFSKKTEDWGIANPVNSNGAAYADLDNDGDLDLVLNNMEEVSFILENQLNTSNNYVQINVIGPSENRFAIGAKVKIETEEGIQYQEIQPSRGFISCVDLNLHFGLGSSAEIKKVEIKFPDGKTILRTGLTANKRHSFNYTEAIAAHTFNETSEIFFKNITDSIFKHTHFEEPFNDFETEVLIPNQMSQLGPFIAKGDVNQDGLEDLYVSGSINQSGALYVQTSKGFIIKSGPWNNEKLREEMEALFLDVDSDGDLDLYVVSGSNEFNYDSPFLAHQLYINDGTGNFENGAERLPAIPISGQSVEAGDYDNDGDLDLFIGGRQIPGFYPFTPRSFLFKNEKGTFSDVTNQSPDIMKPGMVTDALFDDFDEDGDLDLIMVGEWMPVSFFKNEDGTFINVTEKYNPSNDVGWFYSIEKGDFNGDGKSDYLVGNLGLNNKFHPSFDKPLEIYCHDFDGNGTNDIVLGKYQNNVCFPVRGKQCSSEQMPFIKDKFPKYGDFARADLSTIYGKQNLNNALHFSATNFSSMVFMSNGSSYSIQDLPMFCQMGPINKFIVTDLNEDGNLDVISAGNNFAVEVETIRYDGGRGTVLLGDGKGNFEQLSPAQSGFFENNDCKDMELVKFKDREILITVSNLAKAKTFLLN